MSFLIFTFGLSSGSLIACALYYFIGQPPLFSIICFGITFILSLVRIVLRSFYGKL